MYFGKSACHEWCLYLDKDTSKTYVSRHVIFDENSFPFQQALSKLTGSLIPSIILLLSYIPFVSPLSHVYMSPASTISRLASPILSSNVQSHMSTSLDFS